jgi:hypothetical protein
MSLGIWQNVSDRVVLIYRMAVDYFYYQCLILIMIYFDRILVTLVSIPSYLIDTGDKEARGEINTVVSYEQTREHIYYVLCI